MDQLAKKRWVEIELYFTCLDILKMRNDILDVMNIIDYLAPIGDFNTEQAKILTQELLSSIRYRPTREEFCILAYKKKIPIAVIKRITKIHNRTFYNMVKADKNDNRLFYPRLAETQTETAQKLLDAFNKLKRSGFYV